MSGGRALKILALGGTGLVLGASLGWLAAPGAGRSYLELQQQSDAVHRLFMVAEPLLALIFLLSAMLAYIFAEFAWPRRVFNILWFWALFSGAALLVYLGRFEQRIEQRGAEGQWKLLANPETLHLNPATAEQEQGGPGLAAEVSAGELVLDRRSIFLRENSGAVRWQRKRPGSWPASVLSGDTHFLLALPSDLYPDDLQLFLFETESGRLLWEFHVLGRKAGALLLCFGHLVLLAERPGGGALYVIDATTAQVIGRAPLSAPATLAPRCADGRLRLVEAAEEGGIFLELSLPEAKVLARAPACQSPQISCEKGRPRAWREHR